MSTNSDYVMNAYRYNKTFSGTDTLAFILFPGCVPIVLGALTTISYSMFRNKKPVINIGRTNINGVTRGSRIYAGTMIFTLVNQHWLREVCEQPEIKGWLGNYNELKVDELPLFDIMIVSANEYGNWCHMFIYGIDFTDEAQTVSVEDLFTENTFSFVARDISTFEARSYKVGESPSLGDSEEIIENIVPPSDMLEMEGNNLTNFDNIEQVLKDFTYDNADEIGTLDRELYFSTSNTMIGNDIALIQERMKQLDIFKDIIEVNGIFDAKMEELVKQYQSYKGFSEVNGIIDNYFYLTLMNDTIGTEEDVFTAYVINKNGTYVYRDPSLNSDIIDFVPYNEVIRVWEYVTNEDEDGTFQTFYKTNIGYILSSDMFSYLETGSVIEFPTLKETTTGPQVTMVQQILSELYPEESIQITVKFTEKDIELIESIKEEYGYSNNWDMLVDNDTWLLLQTINGNVSTNRPNDNFYFESSVDVGAYNATHETLMDMKDFFTMNLSCDNEINVKFSMLVEYESGAGIFDTITKTIKENETFNFMDAFEFDLVNNVSKIDTPAKITFTTYPYNKAAYKWTINVN